MPSTRAWSRICCPKMLDSFCLHLSLSPCTLPLHLFSWPLSPFPHLCGHSPCQPRVIQGISRWREALYPRPFSAGLRRALARDLGKRRVPGERGWGRGEVRGERVEGEERTAEKQERQQGDEKEGLGERGVGKGERVIRCENPGG